MEFKLLGPVLAIRNGEPLPLRGSLQRALLAALLLDANAVVTAERLIDRLWEEDPPTSAVASLRNHVLRLRVALGDEEGGRLRTSGSGFLIEVGPDEHDVYVFVSRCRRGRGALSRVDWDAAH